MHIETFVIYKDLAELRSISKTAQRHNVSQSAISQQLAQLETIHKCQLVDRRKRPFDLTKQGELMYQAAKDITARYDELKSQINAMKYADSGRINVAAIFSIGMHSLQEYVKRFMVRFSEVNVHVEYLEAGKIYELLLKGEIDIGIVAVPKRDRRLEVYDFNEEPLVLACSSNHPLASESEIDINAIQFERFIAFEEETPTRILIDGILNRYSLNIQPVMAFDNIETVKRAVEIGAGVSILPKNALSQEITAGTIKTIGFSNENFVRPTGILIRKNKIQSRPCRYFVKLLTQQE